MTLLPSSDFGIRGHPGNAYDVNERCAHPDCGVPSAHAHHCWPRSHLRGQPYEWVQLPAASLGIVDHGQYARGTVIGNRLGFCVEHHEMLTGEVGGYRARLVWGDGIMWWQDKVSGSTLWGEMFALKYQPPVAGPIKGEVTLVGRLHEHASPEEEAACPTCGHVKRSDRAVPKPGKLRPTKEWTALVPDDAEIGAEILDGWVEDFAIVLGMDEYSSRLKRYHVLAVLLAWAGQHRELLIADVGEAAGRRVA